LLVWLSVYLLPLRSQVVFLFSCGRLLVVASFARAFVLEARAWQPAEVCAPADAALVARAAPVGEQADSPAALAYLVRAASVLPVDLVAVREQDDSLPVQDDSPAVVLDG
jgi:hypothetical protein